MKRPPPSCTCDNGLAAELNARENAHWYKKYIAIRSLIDRAITIGNAQDPGVKLLANWRVRNEKATL